MGAVLLKSLFVCFLVSTRCCRTLHSELYLRLRRVGQDKCTLSVSAFFSLGLSSEVEAHTQHNIFFFFFSLWDSELGSGEAATN